MVLERGAPVSKIVFMFSSLMILKFWTAHTASCRKVTCTSQKLTIQEVLSPVTRRAAGLLGNAMSDLQCYRTTALDLSLHNILILQTFPVIRVIRFPAFKSALVHAATAHPTNPIYVNAPCKTGLPTPDLRTLYRNVV